MRGEEAGLVRGKPFVLRRFARLLTHGRAVLRRPGAGVYTAITVDAEGAENLAATASFPARLRMRRGDG
jgi:hypothetical protein